jgi:hypothetical protein
LAGTTKTTVQDATEDIGPVVVVRLMLDDIFVDPSENFARIPAVGLLDVDWRPSRLAKQRTSS